MNPRAHTDRIIHGWLLLAVFSLVFAGVFALLVALARTPVLEDMLPLGRGHIYVALVGHVVLAVVIWFLAFQGFLWAHASTVDMERPVWSPALGYAALGLCAAGTGLVAVSAIFGLGQAELANYVPVLQTPVFYAGLVLFAVGVTAHLINFAASIITAKSAGKTLPIAAFGMAVAGAGVFVAFLCFGLSAWFQFATNKAFLDFERLMWGGGHILQAVNTIAMVTAWIYLARIIYGAEPVGSALAKGLYASYLAFILPAPLIYFMYDTSSQAYKDSFTFIMRWGLGPSTAVFIIAIARWVIARRGRGGRTRPWKDPGFSSLVLSMTVFVIGGVIALLIRGVNTKIPAHYHCAIGAVTIAFMGLFYEIAPRLGRELYSKRLAAIQPYLYSAGILLFAAGLFLAGEHGVARKTYGSAQNLNSLGRLVGMSIMGIGGLVAISGGITFVWNALLTLTRPARPALIEAQGQAEPGGAAL
ncbi:MAG: cbb3-type cytochrome c oxidase subunit I [Deltaproteobacteria bacterium]|nr:cbb3-type cytochrome c oxidase subunit I [Deltaproteobacteria bacterium]